PDAPTVAGSRPLGRRALRRPDRCDDTQGRDPAHWRAGAVGAGHRARAHRRLLRPPPARAAAGAAHRRIDRNRAAVDRGIDRVVSLAATAHRRTVRHRRARARRLARQSELDEDIDMTSASPVARAWRRVTAWTVLVALLL